MSEIVQVSTNIQQGRGPQNSSIWLVGFFDTKIWDIVGLSIDGIRESIVPYNCPEKELAILQELSDASICVLRRLKDDWLLLSPWDILWFSDWVIQSIGNFIESPEYQGALEIFPIGIFGRSFPFQGVLELSSIGLWTILRIKEFHEFSQLSSMVDDWKILASWTQEKYESYKILYKEGFYKPWIDIDLMREEQLSIKSYNWFVTEDIILRFYSLEAQERMNALYTFLEIKKIFPDFDYTWWDAQKIWEDFSNSLRWRYKKDTINIPPLSVHAHALFLFDQPEWNIRQNSSNCYFVASLWSLLQNPQFRSVLISSLCQINQDTWEYHFPDGNGVTISRTEIEDYQNKQVGKEDNGLIQWPIGYSILEVAYIKYLDIWRKERWKSEQWLEWIQWWSAMEVLRMFLWDSENLFHLSTKIEVNMLLGRFGFEMLRQWASIVVAHIKGPWEYFEYRWVKMANKHTYSVVGYNTSSQKIMVVNPWNTAKILEFDYDEFTRIFDSLSMVLL
jgi:hypothetical protein